MKKVYYLLSAVSMASLLTFSACNKDDDTPSVAAPACKLVKFVSNAEDYSTVEYNAQDKLIKISDYNGGELDEYIVLEYNSQGQVAKTVGYENGVLDWYTTFEYNAKGQISKATDFDSDNTSDYFTTYEYDANGNRTKSTSKEMQDGVTKTFTTLFEYSNGNLVKETENAGSTEQEVTTHEYYTDKEDKLRAFKEMAVGGFEEVGATPSKNLVKKSVRSSSGDSYTQTYTSSYVYEFNEKGFPVKEIASNVSSYTSGATTSTSSDTYSSSYEYQCK
jgi:hypothetical protein